MSCSGSVNEEIRFSWSFVILLLFFWYSVKAVRIVLRSGSKVRWEILSWGMSSTSAKICSSSLYWVTRTRRIPSTRTLKVPSGSFKDWTIRATVPTSNRSSEDGSSMPASRCATSKSSLFAFSEDVTLRRALSDFSRPTKSGTTIWGKTTMSLSGNTDIIGFELVVRFWII